MLVAVLVALVGCSTTTPAPRPSDQPYRARMALGLAGPYTDASLTQAHAAGVAIAVVEMTWKDAEPARGVFDDAYLASVRAQADRLRAQGYGISLNTGLQEAPDWFLDLPGARFVDQDGATFTAAPVPNLIFATSLRPIAQRYLDEVFHRLGDGFALVRSGGGYWGELSYPYTFGSDGHVQNRYWAFDANARATDPVPAWRPGQPSPRGEASTFLSWYLDALVDYQNWQVQALRDAGYAGSVAVLYPSSGMRPGDFDAAVADDLTGGSSAEINGEVQRGYDPARQVAALHDPHAVVYGTWGEQLDVVTFLAGLARDHRLPLMVENANADSAATLTGALQHAADLGAQAFFVVRATDLTCRCDGHATFTDLASAYQTLPSAR